MSSNHHKHDSAVKCYDHTSADTVITERTTSLEINSDIFETSGIYACCKMPSNTDTIGVQIESVTQIIDSRDKDRPCSWPTLMSAQQFWQPHSSHILPLFLSASSCTAQRGICIVLRLVSRVSRHFMADSWSQNFLIIPPKVMWILFTGILKSFSNVF